jgi:hypothetical protein
MKKLVALMMCSSILLLGACGNNDADDKDTVENPPENAPVEDNDNSNVNNNDQTEENNQNTANTDQIPFTSFDLDVDYANFQSFEVEYDNESEGMEAKIEDELNNRTLSGDEAFQELKNRFEQFKFDKNSSNEEVLEEVMKSFDLKTDYEKIDLEIQYNDGTEKEYLK